MAGHSKFKNIMHRKGAQDKKRSGMFSKLSREITVAAKMGLPDPDMNERLASEAPGERAQAVLVPVGEHEPRALLRKPSCRRLPDPGRRAGDQNHLFRETRHRDVLRVCVEPCRRVGDGPHRTTHGPRRGCRRNGMRLRGFRGRLGAAAVGTRVNPRLRSARSRPGPRARGGAL